ncbi:hypothetical protein H8356DRAFT_1055736 [Neocallimastix lanati (nom. inval.)]|uniref:AMP-dependent synthetase/ligase domain-containing protein n=1 Tax=Neocallimastix californiae TaxID=1754190 RepID=A0A1Y2AC98_9FUNG|nr:hypothetical protein H8356DRAFT_1055736 [Neocallimastix sp. JGI-2020a]ORY20094.1 hypothetical protein LY90DRAFT_517070 [Neocallimastix californiae]|eukprot:ORY20094.1 hypothetical protein LY90DRAFT_517070 [Neocallimastix californiae]
MAFKETGCVSKAGGASFLLKKIVIKSFIKCYEICEIYNSYSTTETTVIITIKINDDNHINIGNPLCNYDIYINGQSVELREIEELLKQINKIDFCIVIDKLNSKDVKFLVGYYTIKSEMNVEYIITNYLKI